MARILIVDDHELLRRGLRQVLEQAMPGCKVGEASTSQEALAALSAEAWDLLLLDLNLPGRGGLELLEDVRRDWPRLSVLVVTAYPEEELAIRCFRLGAAGYVMKSAAGNELVTAATRVLGGGRYVTATLAEKLASVVGGRAEDAPHALLSSRELQVLRLIARGLSSKQIAAELHVSEKTVATYRARIGEKIGVSTNVAITRYALQNKLID